MKTAYNLILVVTSLISCTSSKNIKNSSLDKLNPNESTNLNDHKELTERYQTLIPVQGSIIMGYTIDGYIPSEGQLENISHLAISFLRPVNSIGDVSLTPGWEDLDSVISFAQEHNVKTIISFGGGGFKITSELMGVLEHRKNLINNILNFIEKYNLDGFDCDWEPSWDNNRNEMEIVNNTINNYYFIFIKEFRKALDSKFGKGSKSFSAAVLNKNLIWYSQNKQVAHFPQNGWWNYLDWIALMNYDNELGSLHATFNSVFGLDGSLSHWTNFGIPKNKIIIGIPFYARAGWGNEWLFYKDIIDIYPTINDTIDFISYEKNNIGMKDYGFNGVSTVTRKVNKIKKLNLAGVMIWQLAGDLPVDNKKSLLKAINNELHQ